MQQSFYLDTKGGRDQGVFAEEEEVERFHDCLGRR